MFVDPGPQSSLSKFEAFIKKDGVPLFIVFGVLSLLLVGVCGFFAYRRGKRRKERVNMIKMYGWGAVAEMDRVDQGKIKRASAMPNAGPNAKSRGGRFGYYSNLIKSKLGIGDRYSEIVDPYEFEFEMEDATEDDGVMKKMGGNISGGVVAVAGASIPSILFLFSFLES